MPNRTKYVTAFTRLSQRLDPIQNVPCIVFETMDQARPWLERLHNGARDGTGRRRWTPEQQSRNTSDRTNRAATQLRDLAISLGLVTTEALSRTTTTQQRFVSNGRFRQAMGLVRLPDGSLERTSCWPDFSVMLDRFMQDIAQGVVNSRSHNGRREIEEYAQSLEEIEGLERRNVPQGALPRRPEERLVPESAPADTTGAGSSTSLNEDETRFDRSGEAGNGDGDQTGEDDGGDHDDGDAAQEARQRPQRTAIGSDAEVIAALHRVGNQKLIDLYTSLTSVRHPQHTLLAVIGCWSFLESLTRAHGRQERSAFDAYINSQVAALGVENTPSRNARRMALDWISNGGNVTKHDWQAAAYDARQLFNSMDGLKPIIVALLDDIADRTA